jgi:uncharacterized protein (TIGR02466 family)
MELVIENDVQQDVIIERQTETMHGIFPTPVMFDNFSRSFTKKEMKFINDLEQRPNMGNTTSVDNYVLRHKELSDINSFIQKCLNKYLKQVYAPRHDVSLYVTQSWVNYTNPGQYHHKHEHPNSFVSGVLYMNADVEKDKIFFYRSGYQQLKLPTDTYNPFNSESWYFTVGTGSIVLFPSGLTHMVETVEAEGTRISLSFNTFFDGYVGEENDLTGLRLKK